MDYKSISGVPDFKSFEIKEKVNDYVLLIPVINEGERIIAELNSAKANRISDYVDIVICDGGSTDSSLDFDVLKELDVNTLLIKEGAGKQGAQLRMGFYWAIERGYKGFVSIDGNNKDSIEDVPSFVQKLKEGYDLIQGSRFVDGGNAVNTPLSRLLAIKLIHSPFISHAAGFKYSDTTSAFRAYSKEFLTDKRTDIFRDIFNTYELLAYLSIRAGVLGYKICEIPVTRAYPKQGKTPTKISPIKGNIQLFKILVKACKGEYNPR